MNDFNVSSQGQTTGSWDIGLNKAQGATATDKTNVGVAKDSLEAAEGQKSQGAISAVAEHPVLQPPSADAQPVKQLTPQDLAQMPFTNQSPTEIFNTLFDGQLANMQLNGQLSDSEAADLRFGFNNPTSPKTVSDKAIQAQLNQIIKTVKEEVKTATKQDVEPQPDTEGFEEKVNNDFELSFAAAVKQAVEQMNLPEDQAKALIAKTIFAHLNPADVKRSANDLASQLEKKVAEQMTEKYGLPDDYKFTPQTEKFETNLSIDYNTAFNALLKGDTSDPAVKAFLAAHPELAAQLSKLTPEQKAQLQYLHYHPDAQFPDGEVLKNLNGQLQSMLLANMANEFGFPAGWEPPSVKSEVQDTVIQGYYREAF
ncbi:MAG: type III secretion protein, partial [Parachlamydia sp.]